jgi:diacylglycerol kinase family enzyme
MIGDTVPHKLKRYLGRFGYLIWAVWCLIRFRPFKLSVDDGTEKKTIWATEVRIANGRYHGGVELVESADVDTGVIVIQAVVGRSKFSLIRDWVAKGLKLPSRQATTEEFRGRRIQVDTKPRLRISIDGEVIGKTPAVAEVAKRAIEVVVPADAEI